jgi:cell wall-associated NlpC family hydrolase
MSDFGFTLNDTYRASIADFAAKQKGAHYLWGTAGNTVKREANGDLNSVADGFTNVKRRTAFGMPRPRTIPSLVPPTSAARSWGWECAYCTTGGQHVCVGRFQSVPMGQVATYFSNPARGRNLVDTFLEYKASKKDFISFAIDWGKRNASRWSPTNPGPQLFFETLTPRIGFATKDAVSTVHLKLTWGESCAGVKHFDCVGLINAAFAEITAVPDITYEIFQWAHKSVTRPCPLGSAVKPGDIVCVHTGTPTAADSDLPFNITTGAGPGKWHHIGMCLGDAAGSIIQAEEGPVGVTVTPGMISPQGMLKSPFNYRGRVPDNILTQWINRGSRVTGRR